MSRRTPLAMALVALVASGACFGPQDYRGSDVLAEMQRIDGRRATASRFSTRPDHVRCAERFRADRTVPTVDCPATSRPVPAPFAARVTAMAREEIDPRVLRAAALLDLTASEPAPATMNRAIEMLRSAAVLDPDARADLAGALLVRAEHMQQPRDLLEAVEVASAAIEAAPTDRVALFNLALALEWIGLDGEAGHAWTQYLETDSNSAWSEEARVRRSRLIQSAERPSETPALGTAPAEVAAWAMAEPDRAQMHAWDEILPGWADAFVRGDTAESYARFSWASAAGAALREAGADASLAELLVTVRYGGAPTAEVVTALIDFGRGRSAYRAHRMSEAESLFAGVAREAATTASIRGWAHLYLANSRIFAGEHRAADALLRSLIEETDSVGSRLLAGQARWSLGTVMLRSGRYSEAVAAYDKAERLLDLAGAHAQVGAVRMLIADARLAMGDPDAYHAMHRALRTLRTQRSSVWLHNLLYVAAQQAAADGLGAAALRLQSEGVTVAESGGDPLQVVEARLAAARLHAGLGDMRSAVAQLDTARVRLPTLSEGPRAWFTADAQQAEAMIVSATDPSRASAALDSAIAFFSPGGNLHGLLPALGLRAAARLALGDPDGAGADLERAVRMLDEARNTLSPAERRAFSDIAAASFDRYVLHHLATGDPSAALDWFHRSLGFSENAVSLGEHEIGITLGSVADTLLVWVRRGDRTAVHRRALPRDELVIATERARAALETRAAEPVSQGALIELFDLLLRPVRGVLTEGSTLAFATDGRLAGVPFAGLYDRERAQYLVERHPIRMVTRQTESASRSSGAPRSVLLLSGADADASQMAGFAPLPDAAREFERIARLYPRADRLAGNETNLEVIRDAAARAEALHFAGHAVFDDARPERSYLILDPAAAPGGGRISATEVSTLPLIGVRVVVLAACETLRPAGGRGGAFAGLTEAFLEAGAHGLVGSLWRVDDARTAPLSHAFHRALRDHGDPVAALREAQLSLLRSGDPSLRSPAAWAAFRYAGQPSPSQRTP
jgi:CHAT domain-containing protein